MRRFLNLIALFAVFLAGMTPMLAGDPGPTGPTTVNILYGASKNLWPNFGDGTGVIDNGVGPVISGNSYTVSPLVTTTYTLTVTNGATIPYSVTQTVTVNVAIPAMTPLSPATKILSCTKTLAFSGAVVSGCVDPTVSWSVNGYNGGNTTVGTITGGGVYTAPLNPGTYTVRATSNATGAVYQEATVDVVPLPTIDTPLTAAPASIYYGGTSVLTASSSNGTVTLVGGATNQAVTSPLNFTTPTLSATTTYTYTVTNPAGDTAVSTATVTVSSVTMTPLSPTTRIVSLTKTFQPTGGVVSGAVDSSVTWSVNGVVGGNAMLGTIDATGLYTAPAAIPDNNAPDTGATITVRCTSNGNPAVYSEMVITLVKLPTINYFVVE